MLTSAERIDAVNLVVDTGNAYALTAPDCYKLLCTIERMFYGRERDADQG